MTSSPLPPDPYKALNVSKTCSADQVRSSYRKLVLKAHPDRFPNATPEEKQKKSDEFHQIQQAYELLTDDTRRQRYDERVKLAELRAELMKEKAATGTRPGRSAPGSGDFSNHRSFTTTFEPRPEAVYAERIPKPAQRRSYEDELPATSRYDSSSKYEDTAYRSSPRASKQDDVYKSGSRKTSRQERQEYDDPKKAFSREERDSWDAKAASKARAKQEKEREKYARDEKKKSTDKSRKQASESKHYYSSPKMNDYFDHESSEEDPRRPTQHARKRSDDVPRRSQKDERSRRVRETLSAYSSDTDDRSHNDYYHRQNSREQEAWEYIQQAKRQSGEQQDRSRGSARAAATRQTVAPPPAAPTAPKEKAEKRSTAPSKKSSSKVSPPRETRSLRKEKERPLPEIIEPEKPSRRSAYDSSRTRPSLQSTNSAPPKVDSEGRLARAGTWQTSSTREREKERDHDPKSLRRNNTTPLEHMVTGPGNAKSSHGSSKLRHSERPQDTDTESEPEISKPNGYKGGSPALQTSTKFRYFDEPEVGGARVTRIEPDDEPRRSSRREVSSRTRNGTKSRDPSPLSKRPSMHPRTSGSPRVPRASTFGPDSSSPNSSPRPTAAFQRNPSFQREELLFNEIPRDDRDRERPVPIRSNSSTFYTMKDVNFSAPIDKDSVQYADRRRSPSSRAKDRGGRASDREMSGDRNSRDTYPGSRHVTGGIGRQASYAGKAY